PIESHTRHPEWILLGAERDTRVRIWRLLLPRYQVERPRRSRLRLKSSDCCRWQRLDQRRRSDLAPLFPRHHRFEQVWRQELKGDLDLLADRTGLERRGAVEDAVLLLRLRAQRELTPCLRHTVVERIHFCFR